MNGFGNLPLLTQTRRKALSKWVLRILFGLTDESYFTMPLTMLYSTPRKSFTVPVKLSWSLPFFT